MADGIELRARRLKQLKRDKGIPLEKPRRLKVDFLDQNYDPLPQGAAVEHEPNPDLMINIVCIPTGLHLAEGTHWHPTNETAVVEVHGEARIVTVGRQVPNLVKTEEAAANIAPQASVVVQSTGDHSEVTRTEVEEQSPVSQAEIDMARAEAKAMRTETYFEKRKRTELLENGMPRWGLTREQRRAIMGWY